MLHVRITRVLVCMHLGIATLAAGVGCDCDDFVGLRARCGARGGSVARAPAEGADVAAVLFSSRCASSLPSSLARDRAAHSRIRMIWVYMPAKLPCAMFQHALNNTVIHSVGGSAKVFDTLQ